MNTLIILSIVALVVSSVGWKKFVYFISIGYGYSIAAFGVSLLALYRSALTLPQALLCLTLLLYGIRLGTFVLTREIKSASYRSQLPDLTKTSKPMGFGAKMSIWISVVVLYVCQASPVVFCIESDTIQTPWIWIGWGVMVGGLLLESASDAQKSAAKKKNPKRFVDTGLYRIVRCPNYLGEVLFWTGCFLSGIGSYQSTWHWIVAATGYICIVYIMFGGARRLELRQNRNYGDDPEYQKYVKEVPILLPIVPLYSVAKYKWLKG